MRDCPPNCIIQTFSELALGQVLEVFAIFGKVDSGDWLMRCLNFW